MLVGIVEAAWRYSGVGNRRPILKDLRQVVGGVGRGYERTAGRGACETPEGVYRLGRLRIQDLGVLNLDQGKIGSPEQANVWKRIDLVVRFDQRCCVFGNSVEHLMARISRPPCCDTVSLSVWSNV